MRALQGVLVAVVFAVSVSNLTAQGGAASGISGEQIVERVSPSAVLILVGRGDGQTAAIGSGLIVRSDGVILTANHVVKGMSEVQVRLKNGEVYDQVELVASDERRDTAALRIPAVGLPVLPIASAANVPAGAPVFVVSNGAALPWTASSGILSALRMADEVPGAGSGYRLLQTIFVESHTIWMKGNLLQDALYV
ncbi:MAG: S1C family serine protease, partial [Terriglobia bacterium]